MENEISRREFLAGAVAAAGGIALGAASIAQPQEALAAQTFKVKVGGQTFKAKLASTKAAAQFKDLLATKKQRLTMTELNGNEKYKYLDVSFSTEGSTRPSTINAGDIMLYGSNCIVLFYKTHANDGYSYTKIGHIKNTAGLATAAGTSACTVVFK